MRIIAGRARSLPLKTASGLETRPTTDRIKETLFNMIQGELPGAEFLDLFAGSGAIGLEAVSRGAAHATFVEKNRRAAACIRENIEFTGFTQECTLLAMDVADALRRIEGQKAFHVVFMDPPYGQQLERQALTMLQGSRLLSEDALLIVEAALHTDFSYVEDLGFFVEKRKTYKANAHVFLRRRA